MRNSGDALRLKLHNTGSLLHCTICRASVDLRAFGMQHGQHLFRVRRGGKPGDRGYAVAQACRCAANAVSWKPTRDRYRTRTTGKEPRPILSVAAVAAEERAGELAAPVITEEEQAELVLGYVVNQEVRALEAEAGGGGREAACRRRGAPGRRTPNRWSNPTAACPSLPAWVSSCIRRTPWSRRRSSSEL